MLKKYSYNPFHVLSYESLDLDPKLTYGEKLVKNLDWKDKVLHKKIVLLVKVLWRNHTMEEAMWETQEDMQKSYLNYFEFLGRNSSKL